MAEVENLSETFTPPLSEQEAVALAETVEEAYLQVYEATPELRGSGEALNVSVTAAGEGYYIEADWVWGGAIVKTAVPTPPPRPFTTTTPISRETTLVGVFDDYYELSYYVSPTLIVRYPPTNAARTTTTTIMTAGSVVICTHRGG